MPVFWVNYSLNTWTNHSTLLNMRNLIPDENFDLSGLPRDIDNVK